MHELIIPTWTFSSENERDVPVPQNTKPNCLGSHHCAHRSHLKAYQHVSTARFQVVGDPVGLPSTPRLVGRDVLMLSASALQLTSYSRLVRQKQDRKSPPMN